MTASVTEEIEVTAEDHRLARLAALAVSLMWVDAALPSPLPGVKPGLANIVTLLVLRRYGFATAAWVSGLRVVAGSLLFGSFLTPGFMLSVSGASASLLVLWLAQALPEKWFGAVSLSVLAAFFHIGAQLAVVALWWMPSVNLMPSTPVFAAAAWIGGVANGLLAERLLAKEYHAATA
ncbi:MAG: Gx transporter family protein [Betaproteobacteria bacterium]|nr:Gx transporter family protein [Betaproteobacteria bacterium]